MDKHLVVISREWKSDAPITVDVTSTEIGVSMPLEQFLDALAQETGNPTTLFTIASLRARLEGAALQVCEKMKRETAKVM